MIRRSFFFAFLDKSAGLLLALVTMAVVSRLLTPAEVGLFMVASSLVILIEAFRDFGVGAFIIQEPDLSPELARSAATVIALMSLVLGCGLAVGAGLAAALYEMPQLATLIQIATLGFVAAPVVTPRLALLRRDMNFAAVARIGIATASVNALTTISLAVAGYGAFSFAWGSVLAAFAAAVGTVLTRPDPWLFRPALRHWRRVLPFGLWTTVITVLGMLFDAMPRLILGKIMGFGAVGLFSRAVSLSQLPDRLVLGALQPVLLPAMSAQVRARQDLRDTYLLGITMITGLQWPTLACLALLADPIVRLLLGPQWLEAIPLVRIVACATMVLAPVYLAFPVLVALGQVRRMALISLVALPLSIATILIATRFGITAVAWSLFPANAAQVGIALAVILRLLDLRWPALGRALLRSAAVTACTGVVPGAMLILTGSELSPWQIGFSLPGAMLGWGAGLALTGHPLAAEIRRFAATRFGGPRDLEQGVRVP